MDGRHEKEAGDFLKGCFVILRWMTSAIPLLSSKEWEE
jgi:hypothetical protein